MAPGLIDQTVLADIASAIRGQNGTETSYKPSEMAAAVLALDGTKAGIGTTVTLPAKTGVSRGCGDTLAERHRHHLQARRDGRRNTGAHVGRRGEDAGLPAFRRGRGDQLRGGAAVAALDGRCRQRVGGLDGRVCELHRPAVVLGAAVGEEALHRLVGGLGGLAQRELPLRLPAERHRRLRAREPHGSDETSASSSPRTARWRRSGTRGSTSRESLRAPTRSTDATGS